MYDLASCINLEQKVMEKCECKNCGSKYELSFRQIPCKDKNYIDCKVCGERLYSWNEAKIWEAKLLERQENHLSLCIEKDDESI